MSLLKAVSLPVPYNNQGVPGAELADGLNAYSAATSASRENPFFDFITRGSTLFGSETESTVLYDMSGLPTPSPHPVSYQTASMAYQTIATMGRLVHPGLPQPTLVTVWLGNNDVLGGAMGGNPAPANMTDPAAFATMLGDMLQLVAGGVAQATGMPPTIAVANIPNVTDVPYFIDEASFNAVLAANSGGALTAWPGGYADGANAARLTPSRCCPGSPADRAGVSPDSLGVAIPSKYTLTPTEMATVSQYVGGYNQSIAGIVAGRERAAAWPTSAWWTSTPAVGAAHAAEDPLPAAAAPDAEPGHGHPGRGEHDAVLPGRRAPQQPRLFVHRQRVHRHHQRDGGHEHAARGPGRPDLGPHLRGAASARRRTACRA